MNANISIATTMPPSPKRRKLSSSSPSLPESIKSFTLLPIELPSPLPSVAPAMHVLYLRRHEEPPQPPAMHSTKSSRTVFLVNIPVDSTKEKLRGLFASLGGRLEDIRFHGNDPPDPESLALPEVWDRRLHPSGSTAHITFPTSKEVDKIFKTISKERRNQEGVAIRQWGVGIDDSASSSLGLQSNDPSCLF
jgi:ribosomal RNA-processing protein 7